MFFFVLHCPRLLVDVADMAGSRSISNHPGRCLATNIGHVGMCGFTRADSGFSVIWRALLRATFFFFILNRVQSI